MNPLYQALTGGAGGAPAGFGMPQNPMQAPAANGMGGLLGRMQQLAGMFQNPQQMVSRFFPDAPAEMSGDPERLLQWMQQTGKVNPQAVQMARQMIGRQA